MVFVGPIWNVVLGAYQTVLIPDELRSRVGSVERFISWGSIPLGSALGGIALQGMGAKATTLALFAAMLVLALAATVSRAIRDARPAT
jgi:predicted MFS family arabinose efflux permease